MACPAGTSSAPLASSLSDCLAKPRVRSGGGWWHKGGGESNPRGAGVSSRPSSGRLGPVVAILGKGKGPPWAW
jgi:hypothetical protein